MRSLRLRLFGLLVVLGAAAGLAVGAATYLSVRAEADALFDYHLRQMALSLRDQGRIPEDERAQLENPELDYVVQVWSVDGVAIYSSPSHGRVAPLPPGTIIGFSDVRVGSATWRVYGAATPVRIIQVAQPLAVRGRLATAAAWRSVLPIAVAVPVVGVALWWLVGLTLAPIARVAAAARARGAHSQAPLPTDGLPVEVAPLVEAFNALLVRLADAFDAQRAFVADAAHELRTPLTALKLQLSVLRDAPAGAAHEAALERLRAGVDRAARLVDQLLTLARAEPGQPLVVADLDLAEVARQALADAGGLADARGAVLALEACGPCTVRGDATALRSLVRNLVDNAINHGGPAPRVRVRVRTAPGGAQLQVDDSGPGIPPDDRERVFDRFHRREDADGEGSGLGLAIVRAIARRHGGRVRLDASPLGGLRAELWLPADGRP